MLRSLPAAIILSGCFFACTALAAEMKDNPNYLVWAKFKPGSSCTVAADIRDGQDYILIETTRTLVSVTADQVVVQTVTRAKRNGHEDPAVPINQTITAKTDKDEIRETGRKDVDAMGKTFACRVWDSTPAKADPSAGHSSTPAPAESLKATIYVSDDVPGGVVRLEGQGPKGQSILFILTTFAAK